MTSKIKIDKINNNFLKVEFRYDRKTIKKIKMIKGRKYVASGKYWIIPYNKNSLKEFLRLFPDKQIHISSTLKREKNFKKLYKKNIITTYKLNKKVIEKFTKQLKIKGYSKNTQEVYISHIQFFFNYHDKSVTEITDKDIKKYMYYLLERKKCSHSYANQALSAIKFLYKNIFNKTTVIKNITRPKRKKKLPQVLSHNEITSLLNVLTNYKHKSILYITYSGGLRVSEVVKLKLKDIDKQRMLIHIKQSKGYKDRYTILSEAAVNVLNKYIEKYRPNNWLFPGLRRDKHLSIRSAQKIFKKACEKAKIKKDVSIHSLRHYVEC